MIAIGCWLVITLVYAHLAEHAIHRWLMHKPTLGRNSGVFRDHAIEHHGHGRNDINIEAVPEKIVLIASPLFLGCIWLGPWWAVFVSAVSVVYARAWTILHSAIHDIDYPWVWKIPGAEMWREHHAKHHAKPSSNFGTVFIWTDSFFDTKAK